MDADRLELRAVRLSGRLDDQLEHLLGRHVTSSPCFADARLEQTSRIFQAQSYVRLTHLLPPSLATAIKAEVQDVLLRAVRREIEVAETGGTVRRMETVRQSDIAAVCRVIPALYRTEALRSLVSRIAGEPVSQCPYAPEQFVISRMTRPGETHGWHWDDYSYVLVMLVQAPSAEHGGLLELVADTVWNKQDPRIEEWLRSRPIVSHHHDTGHAYLIKGNTTLHRVTPLTSPAVRIMLAMSWANATDLANPISHETLDALYA